MIPLPLAQIAEIIGARPDLVADRSAVVTGPVVIDSRQAEPGSLFAALPGERADGHDFAGAAVAAGAVAVLASRPTGDPGADRPRCRGGAGQAGQGRGRPGQRPGDRGDHRVRGQDHHQGPGRPADRDPRPDGLAAKLLQQRDRPPAHRAAGDAADQVPGLRAVRARPRAHRQPLPDRAARDSAWCSASATRTPASSAASQDVARAKAELPAALPADGAAVLNADDPRVLAMAGRTAGPGDHLRPRRRRRRAGG